MRKMALVILVLGMVSNTPTPAQDWVSQGRDTLTTETLIGVHFINPDTGWVVGNHGTILHTTDGGTHWSLQNSGTAFGLRDVKFVSPRLGWVVGENGTIRLTTDGGNRWNPATNTGTTRDLWMCSFSDSKAGWAVGGDMTGNGTIIHTTNGGSTWVAQPHPVPNVWLKGIFAWDSDTVWACGKEGVVLKTTDGGNNWDRKYLPGRPPPTPTLNSIIFPENTREGWTGGKHRCIYHTTDGGSSWEEQNCEDECPCLKSGVFFTDNQNGWGAGHAKLITSTVNGGEDWVTEMSGTLGIDPDLWDIHAVERSGKTYVWAVGQIGTILHKELESGIDEEPMAGQLPATFSLAQNYPNPFNSSTTIRYRLSAVRGRPTAVTLRVYNILGQEVKTLIDAYQRQDFYTVYWDGKDDNGNEVSSGIYLYRLEAAGCRATKPMVLLR